MGGICAQNRVNAAEGRWAIAASGTQAVMALARFAVKKAADGTSIKRLMV